MDAAGVGRYGEVVVAVDVLFITAGVVGVFDVDAVFGNEGVWLALPWCPPQPASTNARTNVNKAKRTRV